MPTRPTRKKSLPTLCAESRSAVFGPQKVRTGRPDEGAEAVDQGLGAVQRREPRLNIAQPGEVLLARLAAQGLLGVFELLM